MHLFFYSYIKKYYKRNRNIKKLEFIQELLLNPYDNINFIIFNNSSSVYKLLITSHYEVYDNIFKILLDNNCLNILENVYQEFKLLLYRIFNKLVLVNSSYFINNIYLINSVKKCIHEPTDEIMLILKNHYFNYEKQEPEFYDDISYYIFDASELNLSLILNNSNLFQKTLAINILEYLKNSVKYDNKTDFFVYSVSQIFTVNNNNKAYFNVDDIYTFPSFKSTSYRLCMKDYAWFISADINPFVMRIFIKSTLLNGEYSLIGQHFINDAQKEVLIAWGARIKIKAINKCYVKLPRESDSQQDYNTIPNTTDLFINCWLIDCELLPFTNDSPAIYTPTPYVAPLTDTALKLLVKENKDAEDRYNNKYLVNKSKIHGGKVDSGLPYSSYLSSIKEPIKSLNNLTKPNKLKIDKEKIKQFDEYQKKVINNVNQNKFFMI